MILRIGNSLLSPLVHPLNFSTSSSSYSQISVSFRSPAPVLLSEPARFVQCSISQVHSYGTVDYEKRPVLKWNTLYRRISTMENPSLGSGVVLDQCDDEVEKKLSKWLLCRVAKELRKFRRFKLALEVSAHLFIYYSSSATCFVKDALLNYMEFCSLVSLS